MAGNTDLERKLREGIDAAKAGDTAKARRLLSEVARADGRSELAWIWLATVLANPSERRAALRHVLDINPNNNRAREALRQLESAEQVAQPPEPALGARLSVSARPTTTTRPLPGDELADEGGRQGLPPTFFLFVGVVLLILVGLTLALLGSGIAGTPTPTPEPTALVDASIPTNTQTPEDTPIPTPTSTPIPAELVTRRAPTLPPTPTYTPTPSLTPTPRLTPTLQLSTFDMIYISQELLLSEPHAFVVSANGQNEGMLTERVRDVSYAQDAFTFAFVRDLRDEQGDVVSAEIFVATLADPDNPVQLTRLGARDTADPVWSPDGTRLIFSSSGDGDNPDLWIIPSLSDEPVRLVTSPQPEREPAISSDGTRLAFTRDTEMNGFTEIYLGALDLGAGLLSNVTQLTDAGGSSYSPAWSPDGRMIAFASDRGGDGDIYTMDSDGFNERVITVDGNKTEDRAPAISPDGLWLAFTSNAQDDRFQTYIMTVNGTDLQRLTTNFRSDISVSFKPLRP